MKITTSGSQYFVEMGEDIFYKVAEYAHARRVFLVTDKNVASHYFAEIKAALGYTPDHIILPVGEDTKNWRTVSQIFEKLIECGHDRRTLIVALGGGVVGDVAGFAASLFMRGVDYLQVPTTLLAAVDASTGGKTGINFGGLKNYVGTIKQPVGVIINTKTFATLPQREIVSGVGEILKTALLDETLFDFFLENKEHILRLASPFVDEAITRCVALKGGVVSVDEQENGIRKSLNVGHTIGHALESVDGFKRPHGEYVLCGIFYEVNIADNLGVIDKAYKREIQRAVLSVLPTILPLKDKHKLVAAMKKDKKNIDRGISFILPTSRGRVQEVLLKEDLWGL